jgi:hypothetical protein
MSPTAAQAPVRSRLVATAALAHFWFKCFGTCGFLLAFFAAYVALLRHPLFAVRVMPVTALDRAIAFDPLFLPVYATLWLYVSLPAVLMTTRAAVAAYGAWMAVLCLIGLAVFLVWPTAAPAPDIAWDAHPGVAFLKSVDAAGNACPSLHVASAVFAGALLARQLRSFGFGTAARLLNAGWCLAIVYSTLATKQHVAVDALAGVLLGGAFAWVHARRGAREALP